MRGERNFNMIFASASLGFAVGVAALLPCTVRANTANTASKREAAASQFARAEELRGVLNSKPADLRTLAEYRRVVTAYQRVYMITPHATEVSDSLMAVGELNTEMGDHFGRTYYQAAADAYAYLIRDYPAGKQVQEAMLRLGQLQKDQLGDSTAAMKTLQDFQKKYPRSSHRRAVQESLAELALLKGTEAAGAPITPKSAPVPSPASAANVDAASSDARSKSASGGEPGRRVAVPHVQRIRTSVTSASTEVVIDLEDTVQYASGRIANPDRIYFDLHTARLSPALAHGDFKVTGDLLTQIRVAQNHAGVVRVVLNVNGVSDYAASLTKKPAKLVIELYSSANRPRKEPLQTASATTGNSNPAPPKNQKTDGEPLAPEPTPIVPPPATTTAKTKAEFQPSSNNAAAPTASAKPLPAPSSGSLTKPVSAKSKSKPELIQPSTVPQPTRDGQATLTRTLGLKIGRIVVDAGHGGHDTGTIGPTGLMEKDLCLDVALRLGKLIQQKMPGAEIVYTRSDDTFIPLEERTNIANEAQADLFISIHANSSPDHEARGVETYYLNLKGSPEAMEVAARENAASDHGVHDLQDMVKQIARTEKIDESKEFAEDVQDALAKRMQKASKPVKNRGVRKAPFVVLIGADMPSILTEISFLSNPADETLLKKPEHRQRVAEGVFQGMTNYLQNMNSVATNANTKPNRAPVVPPVEQSRNQK
jgi:N-acetylmuramoyl-L-alanine amidase